MKIRIEKTETLEIEIPTRYALPYINRDNMEREIIECLKNECIMEDLNIYEEEEFSFEILSSELEEVSIFKEYEIFSKGLEITNEYIKGKECYLMKNSKLIPICENVENGVYLIVNREKLGEQKGEFLGDGDFENIDLLDYETYWIDLENLEYCIVENLDEEKEQNITNNNLGYFTSPSIYK